MKLEHFRPEEFREWYPYMSPVLLAMLDELREVSGSRIIISPTPGALGRMLGFDDRSQHNYERWGEVRAADIMALDISLPDFYGHARAVGFTGIGVYPHWRPYPGLHVDVREDRTAKDPALWAGIRPDGGAMKYVGIEQAWQYV